MKGEGEWEKGRGRGRGREEGGRKRGRGLRVKFGAIIKLCFFFEMSGSKVRVLILTYFSKDGYFVLMCNLCAMFCILSTTCLLTCYTHTMCSPVIKGSKVHYVQP